jgi:23S rRNA (guanosine2251-2'-O)-methyltransferase
VRKLNAKQLRSYQPAATSDQPFKKNEIYIILDDVLDTYNIGAVFRLADAVAAKKIFLCAGTDTPPNPRIKKSSINTTEWVEWEYFNTAVEAISYLRSAISKIQVVAIEQDKSSVAYDKFEYRLPLALVVGNESLGVSRKTLEVCDVLVELPMFGVNVSLNVMVSLGIVLYHALSMQE